MGTGNQTKQQNGSTAMSKPLPKALDSEIAITMTRMIANWPNFSVSPATVSVWKEEWRRMSDRYGLSTLQEIVTQFIREPREFPPTPGMILERCHEKWPDGPPRSKRDESFQPPQDPVTQEQLDRFNSLVKDIAEGKVLANREPKDRQELHEKISKGMKAVIVDAKAEAANDK